MIYLVSRKKRQVSICQGLVNALLTRDSDAPPVVVTDDRTGTRVKVKCYPAVATTTKVTNGGRPVLFSGRKPSAHCDKPIGITRAIASTLKAKNGGAPLTIRKRPCYVTKGIVGHRSGGKKGNYNCRRKIDCALAARSERYITCASSLREGGHIEGLVPLRYRELVKFPSR